MHRIRIAVVLLVWASLWGTGLAKEARKNVVLIAGMKSHGPEGNGIHDYAWSARLIKTLLEHSNIRGAVNVTTYLTGWPSDQSTLEHADTIVTVGAGVGAPERIEVVRKLAQALGAPLGATRDVADLGWLPRQCQIGLSGKSVSPDLYIAVAVRGPLNHTVGIQKAGTVVAINNSARAPIFRAADFGIVGDYAEVVPALTRALADRRASSAQA